MNIVHINGDDEPEETEFSLARSHLEIEVAELRVKSKMAQDWVNDLKAQLLEMREQLYDAQRQRDLWLHEAMRLRSP